MTRRCEESGKEATKAGNKLDELKRENHRLKNQMEDLKREKVCGGFPLGNYVFLYLWRMDDELWHHLMDRDTICYVTCLNAAGVRFSLSLSLFVRLLQRNERTCRTLGWM